MLAFGNDEIASQPPLGETIACEMCGQDHAVTYGETVDADGTRTPSKLLAFFTCGERTYLAGIKGRRLPPAPASRPSETRSDFS